MTRIEVELDDATEARLRCMAEKRSLSVPAFVRSLLEQLPEEGNPLLGMFRNEPDLIDAVVRDAMAFRRTAPERQG